MEKWLSNRKRCYLVYIFKVLLLIVIQSLWLMSAVRSSLGFIKKCLPVTVWEIIVGHRTIPVVTVLFQIRDELHRKYVWIIYNE